jgi:hypothetical protein
MLGELLTIGSFQQVTAVYSSGAFNPLICEIYDAHRKKEKSPGDWEHAEEFLERLDLAVTKKGASLERFKAICGRTHDVNDGTIPQLHFDGLRLLAGEICMFTKDLDSETERMAPYVSWANMLEPQDVVITFNYDRVPDLVEKREGKPPLSVPLPHEADQDSKGPIVLKMHGSVDWRRKGMATEKGAPEEVLACGSVRGMAIATPGPTKQEMITGKGPFVDIWKRAEQAIRGSAAIVFCGYRMPPTDARTKQWLIDALRESAAKFDLADKMLKLPIHTVLGPDLSHEHSQRLKGLLLSLDPRIAVKQWPLGAEDFLGLIKREEILDPKQPIHTAESEAERFENARDFGHWP